MISAVLRRGFVGEDLVVSHVIPIHIVAGRTAKRRGTGSQIADEGGDGDIDHIIAEAPAIGPPARNDTTAKASLNGAGEGVAAEWIAYLAD